MSPTSSDPDALSTLGPRRLRALNPDEMNPVQREIADEATAGPRGHVPVPLQAWLHSPELSRHAHRLGEFVRYHSSLGPQLSEMAILVTARFWTSHYEWYAHKRAALKAGLDPAVIDAIAERRTPVFADPRFRAVYDYAVSLHRRHGVDDATYGAAVEALGEQGVVELVGILECPSG